MIPYLQTDMTGLHCLTWTKWSSPGSTTAGPRWWQRWTFNKISTFKWWQRWTFNKISSFNSSSFSRWLPRPRISPDGLSGTSISSTTWRIICQIQKCPRMSLLHCTWWAMSTGGFPARNLNSQNMTEQERELHTARTLRQVLPQHGACSYSSQPLSHKVPR